MRAGEALDRRRACCICRIREGRKSEAAAAGDPKAYRFPRTFLNEERLEFSFSGIKTAVRMRSHRKGPNSSPAGSKLLADLAASFQQAVVDTLIGKAEAALRRTGYTTLCVSGGVAAEPVLSYAA